MASFTDYLRSLEPTIEALRNLRLRATKDNLGSDTYFPATLIHRKTHKFNDIPAPRSLEATQNNLQQLIGLGLVSATRVARIRKGYVVSFRLEAL